MSCPNAKGSVAAHKLRRKLTLGKDRVRWQRLSRSAHVNDAALWGAFAVAGRVRIAVRSHARGPRQRQGLLHRRHTLQVQVSGGRQPSEGSGGHQGLRVSARVERAFLHDRSHCLRLGHHVKVLRGTTAVGSAKRAVQGLLPLCREPLP